MFESGRARLRETEKEGAVYVGAVIEVSCAENTNAVECNVFLMAHAWLSRKAIPIETAEAPQEGKGALGPVLVFTKQLLRISTLITSTSKAAC